MTVAASTPPINAEKKRRFLRSAGSEERATVQIVRLRASSS